MTWINEQLSQLAEGMGISTRFINWKDEPQEVPYESVIAILASMGIDASDDEKVQVALENQQNSAWTALIAPVVVVEQGQARRVYLHLPNDDEVKLTCETEEGAIWELPQVYHEAQPRLINQQLIKEVVFELPADLPLGYHRLVAATAADQQEALCICSPHFLGFPEQLGTQQVWGYAAQLYSTRSRYSWELGDLMDMADIATWSGKEQGADFLLVNPLHACQVVLPLEASPYLPASRRFINPIYIRPEAIDEYSELSDEQRRSVFVNKQHLATVIPDQKLLFRDEVWTAKMAALKIIYAHGLRPARKLALDAFIEREGNALKQFATWCVLSEIHGTDWRLWPGDLVDPVSGDVSAFAAEHSDQVMFYIWLQWIADLQLLNAQSSARDAGMRLGVINDLAVGVGEASAEAWTYGELFAKGVTVGAPPDALNQVGQNWSQLPWRPDQLEKLRYEPLRTLVAGLLRNSGGIRIDHVMGLFRLWWIPAGMPVAQGAYVRYNHEAAIGILTLEAYRAQALIVGEDLGVVEPWVREYLRDRGILGTSVLWFEHDEEGNPLPPQRWREYCLASVTTHDLPPTTGFLSFDHLHLQNNLGLLPEPAEEVFAGAKREQQGFLDAFRSRGFLQESAPSTEEIVLAAHRYLLATSSRIVCATLTDAVGDRLTQNQPGTYLEYPNWRIPLSGPDGNPIYLEEVFTNERVKRLAKVMNQE
ncbi:MAG: 4-alpha-glucanotransferase [Propionibacteriaceae bacterium]|nr:4-alpha-glucanotransferase [Propionibacteriaceae bacterium]